MDVTKALEIALQKLENIDPKFLKSTLITYQENSCRSTDKKIPVEPKPSLKNLEKSLNKRGESLDDFLQRVDSKVTSNLLKWSLTFETQGNLNLLMRVEVYTETGEAIVLDTL
ncbi:MAG: hypothetical protein AAGA60_20945 [Cyanobacteria bacterium P01_E01_bin.42]